MRITTVLPVATLVLSVASEGILVERDVATITNVLDVVGSGLTALDNAVSEFTDDISSIDTVGAALQLTINSGTSSVVGSGDLTLNDAIALSIPVTALQSLGETLVANLISKRPAFEAAAKCTSISSQVSGIQSASQTLIAAIVALVPEIAQGLAASLAAPFEAALAQGADAFTPSNCIDSVITTSSTVPSSTAVETSSAVITTSSITASSTAVEIPTSSTTTSSIAVETSTAVTTSSPATYPTASGSSAITVVPSPVYGTGYISYPTLSSLVTKGPVSGTGSFTKPTSSGVAEYTGAADVNHAVSSFGMLALAAAALVL